MAPDPIVEALNGPFADYTAMAEVPKPLRVANTLPKYNMWVYWSDPQSDVASGRIMHISRTRMVAMLLHIAERLDILPSELWMLIMTFVKNEFVGSTGMPLPQISYTPTVFNDLGGQ